VLPDSIGMLTNLRCLSLAHNELGQLPSSFSCLVSLQQLHLEGNQLRYMPPGLQALQQLQVLNLSHNGLRQLPAAVWGMQQLRELDARHNQLRQLPTNCLNTMPSLHILRLAGNQLRDIRGACSGSSSSSSVDNVPPGRGATSSAGSLGEQGDEGEEEREGVQAVAAVAAGAKRAPLQRLQTLDVSGNLLEQLPSWLPPSLTELNASGNCLASLPVDLFSRLSRRLVVLQLAHNQLPGLPMHLTCLTALRLLSVGGNPGIDGLEDGAHTAGDAGRGQQQPGATYLPGSWPLQWIAAQRRGETWPGIQGGKP
jgi:Leucine-rich repeat (LRR) protein